MNNNINNMNFNNNMNLGNNSNEESQVVTPKNNHIKLGMYKNENDMSNIVFKRTMYVIVAILVIIIIILIIKRKPSKVVCPCDNELFTSKLEVAESINKDLGLEMYYKARDIYVERVYGIITYRFYEFGNNDEHAIPYINLFNRITNSIINRFKSNNLSMREIPINYSKTIIGNFIKDNKKALEFVDNLIKFIGFTEFFLKRSITVNLKQLSRVTNEISGIPYNKLKQTSFEKLFLDNISNLVCGIYQKVLNFI